MLHLITGTIITKETTFTKMVNFKVILVLLLEAKDIIYLIWNLIYNMVDIPKINNKIPFCALGDGHATIVTWLPS